MQAVVICGSGCIYNAVCTKSTLLVYVLLVCTRVQQSHILISLYCNQVSYKFIGKCLIQHRRGIASQAMPTSVCDTYKSLDRAHLHSNAYLFGENARNSLTNSLSFGNLWSIVIVTDSGPDAAHADSFGFPIRLPWYSVPDTSAHPRPQTHQDRYPDPASLSSSAQAAGPYR